MQHPTSREMQQRDHYEASTNNDDFLDQMLANIPSWPELSTSDGLKPPWDIQTPSGDDSVLLASRLRQHQISGGVAVGGGGDGGGSSKSPIGSLQQLMMFPDSSLGNGGADSGDVDASNAFKSPNISGGGDSIYNGFSASLSRVPGQQPFQSHTQVGGAGGVQSFVAQTAAGMGQSQSASAGSGGTAPPRQRVRARRGQATDPHSIAERLRRERIADRMKALQELVPNANKTDKASMLDEIIDYVKFLQLQVKVLSVSRLGGAAAVAPLVADMSSNGQGGGGRSGATGGNENNTLAVTEHQVAKLMEEDMGSAMQYLQGKGLCLMPISLASAISTATGHPRTTTIAPPQHNNPEGPSSPNLSVLTAQSGMAGEGDVPRPAPVSVGKDTSKNIGSISNQ